MDDFLIAMFQLSHDMGAEWRNSPPSQILSCATLCVTTHPGLDVTRPVGKSVANIKKMSTAQCIGFALDLVFANSHLN
jgi:hypothetical protein